MDSRQFLKNAADKSGLDRIRYIENDIPTSASNICVLPFFGDYKSLFIMSSVLLKRYREECKGSKYFVFCSWPGFEDLFPFCNEYWSLKPDIVKTILFHSKGFINQSSDLISVIRNLNHFFEDVVNPQELLSFYNFGITQQFLDRFKHVKRYLPSLPSSVVLGNEFNRELNRKSGPKVIFYPSSLIYGWKHGEQTVHRIGKEFWVELGKSLIDKGITPVAYQAHYGHNLSNDLLDKAIYLTDPNIMNFCVAARATGCLLDVFSGFSKFAALSRTPYICCEERNKFVQAKEYEIDDLSAFDIPREYIYSFCNVVESGNKNMWKSGLIDSILVKVIKMIEDSNRDQLPGTTESNIIVPYAKVREFKTKRFGTRFIKVNQI